MSDELILGQKVPDSSEDNTIGKSITKITRNTKAFRSLIANTNDDIVYKDEENTGADMIMNHRTMVHLNTLAILVKSEWWENNVKLRVTEAWDENDEHRTNSSHYEGRGVDMTTSPRDPEKLGRLAKLAVEAGFDWVFYENETHVHASCTRDADGDWESEQKRGQNPRWQLRLRGQNCVWKEWSSKGVLYTKKTPVEEFRSGHYKVRRANDKKMLIFLGASEKTATQILSLNPPDSYIEINRKQGAYDQFSAKWVGLAWRLHPSGNVKDIRMVSSQKLFNLV